MQDLLDELATIKEVKAGLEAKLTEAKAAVKAALLDDLRTRILEAGFSASEILPLLTSPSDKRTAKSATKSTTWALKTDPSRTYTRGATPKWMRDAMATAGLNCNKAQRRQFIDEHMMVVVQANPGATST